MKKIILLTSAIYMLTGMSAYAGIIIQPTIITSEPAPVIVEPAPTYVVESSYPQHVDRDHHHYDWKYWHDRKEQEEHEHEHHEHEEYDHR